VVIPLVGLAVMYELVGLALRRLRGGVQWADVLQISGLILAGAIALTAPLEGGNPAVLAWRWRRPCSPWKACACAMSGWIPACVLYFLAYALALLELDLRQPQLYTIAAALLGVLMHYLLIRTRNATAALATGLLAQLILPQHDLWPNVGKPGFPVFLHYFLPGAGFRNLWSGGTLA